MFVLLICVSLFLGVGCLALAFVQRSREMTIFCATAAGFNFGMTLANLLNHVR